MFLDQNIQHALAEGTEIVIKTAIDAIDKNASSIAKAIVFLMDEIGKEVGDSSEDSDIEEGMEVISEFLNELIGSRGGTVKRKAGMDRFMPEGYV